MPERESFPRQSARTRRFTLGAPRTVSVAPDGRVHFLRSRGGDDPQTCLWVYDPRTAAERLLVDPAALLSGGVEHLPEQERARRERNREQAAGIVGYSCDRDHRVAAFALSGRAWAADLSSGAAHEVSDVAGAVDPRPDPTGSHVAFVAAGALHVVPASGGPEVLVLSDDDPAVSYGLAEFVAAEEMGRDRGFWWAPDGAALLVARVDENPVRTWWIADPAQPGRAPTPVRYPAAGTANADVRLAVVRLDGSRTEVEWDRAALPYLTRVSWDERGPLVSVQSRDQRRCVTLAADPGSGATHVVADWTDPHWVELVPGVPARLPDGRLVTVADSAGARRLRVDGDPMTPDGLHVRGVASADGAGVVFTAHDPEHPEEQHVWRWSDAGLEQLSEGAGVHGAVAAGDTLVLSSSTLATPGSRYEVRARGAAAGRLTSLAETPAVEPRVRLLTVGERRLRCGLLLPSGHRPGRSLPVLLDPYGGPHAQRVVAAASAWATSQWLADQGFAVLVVDGRGTPGRGPEWEKSVAGDLAEPVLADQVDALQAVAAAEPDLDLSRVAIRGWSFGGYLAALAVLRRPDVFHAAVAGAPVTDWRLYDTHYTERYLGQPATSPEAYERSSLLADAHRLERSLLLVHGLADDNVVVAHTLQLSARLLEAGRPHTVLPLSGVTHMTPQEVVAENLLLLQVDFLRRALG